MQVMNVALGGSLYRDLYNCGVTEAQHRQNPPYYGISHQVTIAKGSLLESVVSPSGDFEVNSMHHQGVDHVAPGLLVAARSEDRVVEAWKIPRNPSSWAFSGIRSTSTTITACSTLWPPRRIVSGKREMPCAKRSRAQKAAPASFALNDS